MSNLDSKLFENCIKNYALPIWKDKLTEYYPKEEAKRFLSKVNNAITFDPNITYLTMENNLGYLDLISSGKGNLVKKDLTEKLSENAPNFEDVLSSHEMLLHSNYCDQILPIFQSVLKPHEEAQGLLKYLKKYETEKQKNA